MNFAVNPAVPMTAWATRARRAAKSATPSQRWSAASGTGEPSDQAPDSRAVPAATVRAPAAATRPTIGSPATQPGYVHLRKPSQLHSARAVGEFPEDIEVAVVPGQAAQSSGRLFLAGPCRIARTA